MSAKQPPRCTFASAACCFIAATIAAGPPATITAFLRVALPLASLSLSRSAASAHLQLTEVVAGARGLWLLNREGEPVYRIFRSAKQPSAPRHQQGSPPYAAQSA